MNESPTPTSSPDNSPSLPAAKKFFHFWRCFWLTFLVVSLAFAWYCFYAPGNDIAWADGYPAAQQQAAESDKPIILYFTGTWCVPCRIMKREVWADDQVTAQVNASFVPVMIDVDAPESEAIMQRYKVTGPPVTIVTDPQGEVLTWRTGGMGKSEFLQLMQESTNK